MDRAILLLAIIQKKKVDAGWIIHNNILESAGPAKALWFPAIITQLCVKAGVKFKKTEEKVKAGLAINAKTSEHLQQGGARVSTEILEELREVKAKQNKILELLEHQQQGIAFMKEIFQSGKFSFTTEQVAPTSVFAGPSGAKTTAQPKPPPRMRFKTIARKKVQPPQTQEESSEETEERSDDEEEESP